jgi:hypothetical protein
MRGTMRTKTRTQLMILAACAATAGGCVIALQAGAAPPEYTTLEQAASEPVGIGDPGVAEGVRGSNRPDVAPRQIFRDAGVARGGCDTNYGNGGQCLPLVPPSQADHVAAGHMKPLWTCREVRLTFKSGLAVRKAKVDPLRLDKNGDGTACGKGD